MKRQREGQGPPPPSHQGHNDQPAASSWGHPEEPKIVGYAAPPVGKFTSSRNACASRSRFRSTSIPVNSDGGARYRAGHG
jgi:hypothetical protein